MKSDTYINDRAKFINEKKIDKNETARLLSFIYDDGFHDALDDLTTKRDDGMNELQITTFTTLLEMFIDDCGLDRIEACKKAQELLEILNA